MRGPTFNPGSGPEERATNIHDIGRQDAADLLTVRERAAAERARAHAELAERVGVKPLAAVEEALRRIEEHSAKSFTTILPLLSNPDNEPRRTALRTAIEADKEFLQNMLSILEQEWKTLEKDTKLETNTRLVFDSALRAAMEKAIANAITLLGFL